MNRSLSETQALAERAAIGTGAPFAQSARFAAGVVRHLIAGRDPELVENVLNTPDQITTLASEAERAIETASIDGRVWEGESVCAPVLQSILEALPCAATVVQAGNRVSARLVLSAPSQRDRPARVKVPHALQRAMETLAERTYVPETPQSRAIGAGAGLMELD